MNYFNYGNLYIENNQPYIGISYAPNALDIQGTELLQYTKVKSNEIYRPDKIAQRLWGVDDSWPLDILNNFKNGIKEYTLDTEIAYVSTASLKAIGLL